MKYLIINEFLEYGGTEIQTQREVKNFVNHGHDVYLITFDPNIKEKLFDNHYNISMPTSKLSKLKNKLVVNKKVLKKLKSIIGNIKPDFIHINNVYSCPHTVYKAVSKYKVFQTIRDYVSVCYKSTCIFDDLSECAGYKNENCKKCTRGFKNKVKKYLFNKVMASRMKYIRYFACPSQALTDKCAQNGYNIRCINNPFDFEKMVVDNKKIQDQKIYLYYGLISAKKGVFRLIEAFNKFKNDKNVKLVFIGQINPDDKNNFESLIADNPVFEYLGKKKNDEILQFLSNVYCTVVPSLWIENYPNTVLESKANKTLVIGSNRGGIKEMIHNNALLFNILDIDDVVNKLEYTYQMSEDEYYSIVESNVNEIKENNSLEKYYLRIMDYLQTME